MAYRRLSIPSQHVQLRIVGPQNSFKASRVQRVSFTTDVPTTEVNELGNSDLAGLAQDTPNITATFSAFDTGIKIFSVLTGTDWDAYPVAGVEISELAEADLIMDIRDDLVADFAKSGHGQRLQVRDFSFSYSVDGEATEDYTLIGSTKRWFKNDVIVDRFTSNATSHTLTQTPLILKNGNYGLSVIQDGAYLTEVTGAPASGEYRIVGTTITTVGTIASQLLVVYHADPSGTNWTDVTDSQMPAAVRGKDIPITIEANSIKRVQSVTINGNLNVQPVKEMGNRDVVGYQKQVPTIDGTITVLDTDTELVSLLTTGTLSGAGISEFSLGEVCPTDGVSLKIEILDPCDAVAPFNTVLKTVYLDSIIVTNEGYTSNVNNNASVTYNFRSTTANVTIYSGAMP
jgi:hypothetical protein